MKIKSGHIPAEVIYVPCPSRTITIDWDDVEREDGDDVHKEEVFPVYVSDSSNSKTLATGRAWAKQNATTWNGKKQVTRELPPEVTRKNEPFTGVHVVGLDVRMNGGRAWKCVIDEGKYYVDLREDNLLDVMRTEGISKGGYLNGEFIWARIGTEMKLIRVGSEIHTAVLAANDRRNMKAVGKKELTPGHLYQQKNGDVLWYVGHVRGWEPSKILNRYYDNNDPVLQKYAFWANAQSDQYSKNAYERQYGMNSAAVRPPFPQRLEIPFQHYRKPLWVKLSGWKEGKTVDEQVKDLTKSLKTELKSGYMGLDYILKLGSDIKVVNDLGLFEYPEFFAEVRKRALNRMLNWEKTYEENAYIKHKDFVIKERDRLYQTASLLAYGTMYADDAEPDPSYDSWATWMLSMEPKG